MPTVMTWRASVTTTVLTWRPSIERTNTLAVIIAGVWIDWATWSETGKFWNDAGDWAWTIYTWRPLI